MATKRVLITELGKALGGYMSGTATAGVVALLTDSSADGIISSYRSNNILEGWYVKITSGDADGDVRQVATYTASAGTLVPDSNFAAAPGTATYELFEFDYPDNRGLGQYVDLALTDMRYQDRWSVSLVDDGDMEESGTTQWATLSSATVAKATTAANTWGGTQALTVTPTAAGGYVQSNSIVCAAGDSFYVEALARPNAATQEARLVVWDVTNAAAITTFDDWEESRWGILGGQVVTAPSGCNAIALRLTCVDNTVTVHWDNVIVLRLGQKVYTLPSAFNVAQAIWVDRYPSPDSRANPDERYPTRLTGWEVLQSATALAPYRVRISSDGANATGPLTVRYKRLFSTLATDTSTTPLPTEFVVAGAKVHAYARRANGRPAERAYWDGLRREAQALYSSLARLYSPDIPLAEMPRHWY